MAANMRTTKTTYTIYGNDGKPRPQKPKTQKPGQMLDFQRTLGYDVVRKIGGFLAPVDRLVITKKPHNEAFTHKNQYDKVMEQFESIRNIMEFGRLGQEDRDNETWRRGEGEDLQRLNVWFDDEWRRERFLSDIGEKYTIYSGRKLDAIGRVICMGKQIKKGGFCAVCHLFFKSKKGDRERWGSELNYGYVRTQSAKKRKEYLLKTLNERMGFEFPTNIKLKDLERMLMKLG